MPGQLRAECPGLGHRRFQQQLRRQAGIHVLLARRRAGLVVQDRQAAVAPPLDPVGPAGQPEQPARSRQVACVPLHLGGDRRRARVRRAARFDARDPVGDPRRVAAPTTRSSASRSSASASARIIARRNCSSASAGQRMPCCSQEMVHPGVHEGAVIRGVGRLLQRLERRQPQHVPGVDRVGIAQPGLDLGHRQPAWPQRDRRARAAAAERAAAPSAGWSSARDPDAGRMQRQRSRLGRSSNVSSRVSQRAGTAGAPSAGAGRTAPRSARRRRRRRNHALPGRRSPRATAGRPLARIGRDSHGPGSLAGGHTPSARPPSTMTSAVCRRASSRPQMNTRGCSVPSRPRSARRLRTTAPSSTASSNPGSTSRALVRQQRQRRLHLGQPCRQRLAFLAGPQPGRAGQFVRGGESFGRFDQRGQAPPRATARSRRRSAAPVPGSASSRSSNATASGSARVRSSARRSPARPGLGRGPRRQASSRSRAAARQAAGDRPAAASGCFSSASSGTGASSSATARTSRRRNTAGGVSASVSPALSSATTP